MASSNQQHEPTMRCPGCGGDMDDVHGDLVFDYPGLTITVTEVPMMQCRACNERLVPGSVGVVVSQLVSELHASMRQFEASNENMPAPTDSITIHYSANGASRSAAIA